MTIDSHARLAESGLLDGPVDPADLRVWPIWAREHLRVCPECQSLLEAERELRRTFALLSVARSGGLRLAPPAERSAWLARRESLPADALARGGVALPRRTMRAGGSALELVRTSRGIRLWHPDATEVLVLASGAGMPPAVIRHARESTPGVGLDLEFAPEQGAEVLAIAAREPLCAEHWVLWLADAIASGKLPDLVAKCSSDFLHIARVTIPPPMRASLLRLRPRALPEASDPVAALLKRAAQAGREDHVVEATTLYGQALEAAFCANDDAGQIKAAMGLSLALRGLGYDTDGDRVLRWLVETHALDLFWAGCVCRHLATDALNRMDLDAAEHWLRDAEAFEGEDAEWVQVVRLDLAAARRQAEIVGSLTHWLSERAIPEGTRAKVVLQQATAMVRSGEPGTGRGIVEGTAWPVDIPLEGLLLRALFDIALCSAEEDLGRLPAIVDTVRRQVAAKDGGVLSAWDNPPLLQLAVELRRAGQHEAALDLFRLRFLDSFRAADRGVRLLGLAASCEGLLVCGPSGPPRLRSLAMPREQFLGLVAEARAELRRDSRMAACRTLGSILFSDDGLPEAEPLWIGSDGLLAEAPMLAVALSVAHDGAAPPAVRELVGPRRSPPERGEGACNTIVSLADAQGDLPWAGREVEKSEAALWLRGKAVTRGRLRLSAPVGLLHLGLHVRREHGVPQLLFADGPLGSVEIAAIPLLGAPVVLLAGCATGVARTAAGVERSLADAFLRAGASAVIATLWPVEDREILPFVRALVEAWPFQDAAAVVSSTCLRLRQQGVPARCWAAPVVY